jgi:amino acid adenylation domain-containing protein/non-ribosomal peptide synthase protein (TIGR01720 family)
VADGASADPAISPRPGENDTADARTSADVEALKRAARAGDRVALQRLRDMGFFARKAGERHGYPASHAQRRLWLIDRMLDGRSAAYNIPIALVLDGALDAGALERALGAVVRRHESLRTTLREVEGEPRQFVEASAPIALSCTDLRSSPNAEEVARTEALRDAAKPFDLTRAPLLRARLLRLTDDRHVFLLNIHHVVFDEWSAGVFVRDLTALYNAPAETADGLPALAIQYRDFAAWQNAQLAGPDIEAHRAYWRQKLAPPLMPLVLPADRPRPPVQTFAGGTVDRLLDPKAIGALQSIAQARSASMVMAFAAVLKALFYRYTRQQDVTIGTATAGRERVELVDQIGFYVNALALRDTVRSDGSFLELLERVRATATEAYEHQAYPFDRLVEELAVERDLSRAPFFDVMLMVNDEATPALALEGVQISAFDTAAAAAKYDLTFDFTRGGPGWALRLIYNSDIYDRDRIERLIAHFERLIVSATDQPDAPLRSLEIITEAEREALTRFSSGPTRHDPALSIFDLFEQQVARTPDRPAVRVPPAATHQGSTLTYDGLNRMAARVAVALRQVADLQPGDRVAVLLDRDEGLVAALLGILKAGGAYLPLDPALPDQRLEFMLRDSNVQAVVTGARHADRGRHLAAVPVLDASVCAEAGEASSEIDTRTGPRDLAYVIYTSGSTGEPKGVEVEHRGFTSMIRSQIEMFGVGPDDNVLQFASCSFDASLSEIFMALLSGACLVCPGDDQLRDLAELERLLRDESITVATLPPSYVRHLGFAAMRPLRTLITAGDAAIPDEGAFTTGGRRYWNAYGPTEFSVCATMTEIPPDLRSPASVPIGRPIANVEAFVLEPDGFALQPIGVSGEICLAGPGLARGYAGRPDLTAERFVTHPFQPGRRLYRTGDGGRWRADGVLEFLGRLDRQVKLRGYRIELGEIEAVLRRNPRVRDAFVLTREEEIVAYVASPGPEPSADMLRRHAAAQLPEYMVPERFVVLPALPLTPSGKVDAKSLPRPEHDIGVQPATPETEQERRLLTIWREVLGHERLGVHDRFFEAGGNSMKAILLVSRVLKQLGVKITIRDVFTHDTVAALARHLTPANGDDAEPIPAIPSADRYALSHAQRRLWTIDRMGEGAGAYHIPGAMRISGAVDAAALERALEALMARHESLRTTFVDVAGSPRQAVHDRLPLDFAVLDWSGRAEADEQMRREIERDAPRPFDLERGPLLRTRLCRLTSDTAILYLNMHHLISDGWSMEVLFRDLIELYTAAVGGGVPALPALRVQYKDFAAWQNARLERPAAAADLEYWRSVLSAPVPVLDLPADRPRPPVKSFRGASVTRVLDPALSGRLRQRASERNVSMVTVWLSLVYSLLHRYTGADDIVIGMPASFREHPDLEDQVGFFVNMIPLRLRIAPAQSHDQLVEAVRDALHAAFEHKDYPYDRLVEGLDLRRDVSRNPLFDVVVSVSDRSRPAPSGRLTAEPFPFTSTTSKFDLTVFLSEDAEGRWELTLEYDTALFDDDRIARLGEHLEHLARSAMADGGTSIARLDLIPHAEWQAVVRDWNDTATAYPRDQGIARLFRQTAGRVPGNPAVHCGDRVMSYHDLDVESDRVAAAVRRMLDGKRSAPVAVLLERSHRVPIALLGVLKAGAYYVALDTAWPPARIATILQDAGCDLVISERLPIERLLEGVEGVQRIDLDLPIGALADGPVADASGGDLAYAIYTSGSTGRPKGVLVEQRSVVRLVLGTNYVELSEHDRILQTGSIAFDASTFEIWGALLNGGCVCLPPAGGMPDGEAMREWVTSYRPTVMWLTASLFNQMAEFDAAMFGAVRVVLTGGERLSPWHVNLVRETCPSTTVVNGYGPTENTTFSLCHRIDRRYEEDIPLGRPIANSRVYVLDSNLAPVPIGIPGEIVVAGDGVARGYLNRPELSARRFIPDPFVADARAYRTGDRGAWRSDGTVAFLGRFDDQVKVRGFRVEPAEIEAELRAAEGVLGAIVVARGTSAATQELIAYVTGPAGSAVERLRERLRSQLPAFMIPAHIVALDRIPLTANGKIDKAALPSPERDADRVPAAEQPSTEAERALADVWGEVLGRNDVGVGDNYFDLGGDSIRAIQIVSRLRRLGWAVRVRDFFQHPTISALAPMMARSSADLLPVSEASRGEIPLSPVQKWFFSFAGSDRHHFNQSVLLRAMVPVEPPALELALAALWSRHDLLRASFTPASDGAITQWVHPAGSPPSIDTVDLTASPAPNAALEAHAAGVQQSLNPDSGRVLRMVHYRLPDGDRILLVAHHLVVDGVSWRILLEDLETAYRQARDGQPVDLDSGSASFGRWTRTLAERAARGGFDAEREYWNAVVGSPTDARALAIDDADFGRFGDAETVTLALTSADTKRLVERTHAAYGTDVDEVLLTAFGRALHRWRGTTRTLVTLERHGREMDLFQLDLSRTVGWFTALFPFVLDVSARSIGAQLKRVKDSLRRVPNGGIGYGALRYLTSERLQEAFPPVSFNYLGQFDQATGEVQPIFEFAGEPQGREISPTMPRSHHLEVSGLIAGGRLQMAVAFLSRRFQRESIESLVAAFQEEILAAVDHCASKDTRERTPSDFSSRIFDPDGYDAFLQKLELHPAAIEDIYFLSPMQEGLLYRDRLAPDSTAYHVQMDFHLRGAFNPTAYFAAWDELGRRHPILRTMFVDHDRPVQVVMRECRTDSHFQDLSQDQEADPSEQVDAYKAADLAKRFDLGRAPLWRVALFRTGPDHYRIVLSYHHILIDGWSLGILYAELFAIYGAQSAARALERSRPRPFSAFVRWLERRDLEKGKAFWAEYLQDLPERTALPRAPGATPPSGYAFAEQIVEVGERLTRELTAAAGTLGVTTYTLLQTAWAAVLARYNGSRDVVFGSVVSGRPAGLDDVEETVGLFINTVPVRVRITPGRSVADTAKALQQDLLRAEEFHFVPLSEIQRTTPLGSDTFDHLLVFENYPVDSRIADDSAHKAMGFTIESFEAHDESHYAFNMVIVPGETIRLRLTYDAHVHPRDWVNRFAGHLLAALEQTARAPLLPIDGIELLSADERASLLARFQGSERPARDPRGRTVIELFEEQARRTPDAVAVRFRDAVVTFGELRELSDRFASVLTARVAIRADDRVALLLERSDRLVVAILGVLKAGGAYVPIDPGYPAEHIAFLLADSGSRVVLVDRSHDTVGGSRPVLDLDAIWNAMRAAPATPAATPAIDHLAYVIYTSGSTGRPKGCEIEHGNLAHYLQWAAHAYFDDETGGAFGLYSSLSFDLTVTSLFLPLVRGRALTVYPQRMEVHDALREMLAPGSGVDALKLTPSHISLIPDLGLRSTSVSVAIVGGEALTGDHVSILLDLNPRMAVFNEYGPTETTVGCAVKRIGADDRHITIGRPIDGTRIYVLDAERRPAPIGVRGEIFIGGRGVGRGYLGRPDLTRERFVDDPHVMPAGSARLYRTGDVGRWLPDGEIEYLGRADDQLKIRGHRIEPGEVEEAVRRTGLVEKAAVVARRVGERGDLALVAYVTGCHSADAVRAALVSRLPDALVPTHIVRCETLPLTPNGKLDRAALPDPQASPVAAGPDDRPQGELERQVAQIWQEVLGVPRVGRLRPFFSLGGHSLTATQVVSRILRRTGVKVSLQDFFHDATVSGLAQRIARSLPETATAEITAAPVRPHYALSHAQQRLWLLHQMPGGETAYNMPLGVVLEGPDVDLDALRRAFVTLIARHEALRTAFIVIDGEPRQRILTAAEVTFDFPEIDLRQEPPQEADRQALSIAEVEAHRAFDLTAPPLLRAAIVRLPENLTLKRTLVLLTVHHIVGDGWSMVVLAREISALYEACRSGRPDPLSPLRVQYKDFSEWQTRHGWDDQEAWWLSQLAGMPEKILLPYDFPPAGERNFRGAIEEAVVDSAAVTALRTLAMRLRGTLAHAILALFQLVLYRISGQTDIVVGMSVANRNHRDLEGLIGFFVNLLPIRTRFSEEMSLDDLVERVARTATAALDRQDYPFDLLVQRMRPERLSNRQPLLNVVYAFQRFDDLRVETGGMSADLERDQGGGPAAAAGLQVRRFDVPFRTSKFDLTLFAIDGAADGALRFVLEYDTGLFQADRARQILDLLVRFAGAAAGHAEAQGEIVAS